MSASQKKPLTPWQKVYSRFNTENQAEFARLFGCDRSKICRALDDTEGLINGTDQKRLIEMSREQRIRIEPTDMLPGA